MLRLSLTLGFLASATALQLGGGARAAAPALRPSCSPSLQPAALFAAAPSSARRTAAAVMQVPELDSTSASFYDEYVQTDPETGESRALSLGEKEKLYLECLDAFYNEDGKQILGNDEYEQLKLDLDFDGSKVATFSKDEIKFVLANKRFKMGKAIMDDKEYDTLRERLRAAGSSVVIHEGAKCDIDTGICKSDLSIDSAKTRLLYLPGTIGGSLLLSEVFFWTLHIDPLLSLVLGAVPAYFFGVFFTENIFAQKPLVATANCPTCEAPTPVFFGDLFAVMTDGLAGPPAPPDDTVTLKCAVCKIDLTADRSKMIMTGAPKK